LIAGRLKAFLAVGRDRALGHRGVQLATHPTAEKRRTLNGILLSLSLADE